MLIDLLLDFFNVVANLKNIPRQGWIDKLLIDSPESVSDHSYSMTVMCLVYSEILKLDTLKVLKMSLIHDLAESKTGDLTPEQISKEEKQNIENQTMNEIIKNLPSQLEKEFIILWKEFQEEISLESKLVHQIDKLEMVLQAKIYEKEGFTPIQPFLDSAETHLKNNELKELFLKIIKQ